GLATAWSERWQVARRDVGDVSASRLVEGLHAALRAFEPDTVVLPMPLDRHPDHAALGRLAMLAMLEEPGEPDLLAYLVHDGPGWPAHRGSAGCGTIPRPGGCSASLAWADLRLDPPTIALKASLIEEYRSQLGRGAVLRPFAAENEPFTGGVLVHANRAMSHWRPGVHRASGGVSIDVPRSACGADVAGGGRLRLRYVEAGEIQERLVVLGAVPQVLGGAPGVALGAADDVRVALAPRLVPYGHHPPGLGLLLAGWFRLTGNDGPRTARALPALFHLVSVLLLFGLLRRQYSGAPALMAALALAVVPMSSYFGKLVNFEPVVLPLM